MEPTVLRYAVSLLFGSCKERGMPHWLQAKDRMEEYILCQTQRNSNRYDITTWVSIAWGSQMKERMVSRFFFSYWSSSLHFLIISSTSLKFFLTPSRVLLFLPSPPPSVIHLCLFYGTILVPRKNNTNPTLWPAGSSSSRDEDDGDGKS